MSAMVGRGKSRWILLFLVAAATAGAVVLRLRMPVSAEVVSPVRKEVVELVVATGRLRAVRQAEAGSEVAGVVEEVLVQEGDQVKPGQRLATLRPAGLLQQLEQAQSGVEAARQELNRAAAGRLDAETQCARVERLFEQRVSSDSERDSARAARDIARASEQSAAARLRETEALLSFTREQIGKRSINAPFGGMVLRRQVEPGDAVTAGQALVTVAEMERTEIYVETDENNLARLRVGQPALVIAPAFAAKPFSAELVRIGPNVDAERGVVGVRLKPGPLPDYVLPNMTVDVNIEVGRHTNALALPTSSLLEQDGQPAVMAVREQRLVRKPVTVIGRNTHWAAVAGLSEDARVLLRAALLPEGKRVRPVLAPSERLP